MELRKMLGCEALNTFKIVHHLIFLGKSSNMSMMTVFLVFKAAIKEQNIYLRKM